MARRGRDAGTPEPPLRNGWKLYQWRAFGNSFQALVEEVEQLRSEDPAGYRSHPSTKQLAAIFRLITEIIPRDPNAPEFRQGNTLGAGNRHWFSAGFHERYRLFFRFRSDVRVIVYAWVNDDSTLRARGSRSDAYSVFERMLAAGAPPGDWDQLMSEAERLELPT